MLPLVVKVEEIVVLLEMSTDYFNLHLFISFFNYGNPFNKDEGIQYYGNSFLKKFYIKMILLRPPGSARDSSTSDSFIR